MREKNNGGGGDGDGGGEGVIFMAITNCFGCLHRVTTGPIA